VTAEELGGAGADIDLAQPFGVLLQHPVTNEAAFARQQMWETIDGWPRDLQVLAWWPGQDAGADRISKALREEALHRPIHTVRNLPPGRFLKLLTQATVLVGNSQCRHPGSQLPRGAGGEYWDAAVGKRAWAERHRRTA
jgi:hypothetical protein